MLIIYFSVQNKIFKPLIITAIFENTLIRQNPMEQIPFERQHALLY